MTGGGSVWSLMHEERSKIMNSSAFSCGVRGSSAAQQLGNVA
jgi:hypothetical protein